MSSKLIQYLRGEPVHPSRSVYYEPNWIIDGSTNEWLEGTHDYIQWAFPTTTKSGFVSTAPVLTFGDIAVIKSDPLILGTLTGLRDRMRRFYVETRHWRVHIDHNHARITRILDSTKTLFSVEVARDFHEVISKTLRDNDGFMVNARTRRIWQQVVAE